MKAIFGRKRILIFFFSYLAIVAICSIRLPVNLSGVDTTGGGRRIYHYETNAYAWHVIHPDIFDRVSSGDKEPPLPQGYAFVEEGDFETISFDAIRYIWRTALLFVAVAVLWFVAIPQYAKLKGFAWLVPLMAYSVVAIWRLLYVPCIWVVTNSYRWRPATFDAETRALWDIGTAQVRYGLLLFEELVLLVLVAAFYCAMFVVFPQLHPKRRPISQ
jgi:hypothetical protein